jgi:hypothetical protein
MSDPTTRFYAGETAGRSPSSDAGAAGRAETTTRSPWVLRPCPVCGHTFRSGDTVHRAPDGRITHDMPGLRCTEPPANPEPPIPDDLRLAFLTGLRVAWPVAGGRELVCLTAAHRLLAGPPRYTCPVCLHTLRPGETVVPCPCGRDPERCCVAIHSDPLHQRRCWDAWAASRAIDFCPATGKRDDDQG